MPPNIAFLISRSAELKAYAPVIITALKRNLPVFLLCGPDPENSWPHTPLYRPVPDNMLFPGSDRIVYLPYHANQEATCLLAANGITDLFILRYRRGSQVPPRPPGCRLRALQFMADYLYILPEHLPKVDTVFVYSPKMAAIYRAVHPDVNPATLTRKMVAVGNPVLDTLPDIKRHSAAIKKKYHLPDNQRVVLLLSLNIGNTFWQEFIFGSPNVWRSLLGAAYYRQFHRVIEILRQKPRQKDIIANIKNWCRSQNAALIIKSRAKHDEPQYVINAADRLITDSPTWYPYPALELISISDLVITFNSTSVLEAAACGTYTVSLDISQNDTPDPKGTTFLQSGIFDNPAVSQWLDYRHFSSFLKRHKLSDFSVDPAGQQDYLKTFLGPTDGHAADRIINHVCAPPQPPYSRPYSKTPEQLQTAQQ